MTTFLDGPATGIHLMLRRSPIYLRVTRTTAGVGVWDALDQLCDAPNETEQITVYRLVARRGTVHVDFSRGKGRNRSGWFPVAEYRLHAEQPADEILRSTPRWRAWCETQWECEKARRPTHEVPG